MIRHLRGQLAERDIDVATIDVHGVGYEVFIPARSLAELPEVGAEVAVHVHTHVREDALLLYGFAQPVDRDVFRLLLGVSGIGPKVALQVLGVLTASELVSAILENRPDRMHKVPGVGKKTAERLVLDLRDKVKKLPVRLPASEAARAPTPADLEEQVLADLESALLNLGYRQAQAQRAVAKVVEEVTARDFETLLREALKRVK